MQIVPLGAQPKPSRPARSDGPGEAAPSDDTRAGGDTAAPLRTRGRAWSPTAHRETAGAQQTLNYLDQLAQRLQQLKSSLSQKIAASAAQADAGANDAQVEASLQETSSLWQARRGASGGWLDGQLRFDAATGGRQRFTVRGITAASLASGARETLSFSTGNSQRAMAVTIEAGDSAADVARRLDRALSPAGVRVSLGDDGEPVFSASEADWPAVRDSLSVKGGGIRFPAGQAHRVGVDAEPDAIRPQQWKAKGDTAELRRSLQEVTQALERVRRVSEAVRRALDSTAPTGSSVATTTPGTGAEVSAAVGGGDQAWARAFADQFQGIASLPPYEAYAAVAPALSGVNRSRVMSLLALD